MRADLQRLGRAPSIQITGTIGASIMPTVIAKGNATGSAIT